MSKTTFLALCLPLLGWAEYRVVNRFPVPGDGGFDYMTFDASSRRLYVSHGTKLDVLEADSGRILGSITGMLGVHGIAISGATHRGFITAGGEDRVIVFDLPTLKVIRKVDVGQRPDGIFYHSPTNRVFTNNHGSHDISVLDGTTGDLIGTVPLKGDAEETIAGPDGLLYTNVEDTAEVAAYDPKALTVVKRFPIGVAKVPTGLAYDAKNNRLFITCRTEPKMVVMDAATGKVVASYPIGTGPDWAEFDSDSKDVLVSTSEGVLNVFRQKSADVYQPSSVPTQQGSRTMAFDRKTKRIFLPSALYDEQPAADGRKGTRRVIRPGTFAVLVLDK